MNIWCVVGLLLVFVGCGAPAKHEASKPLVQSEDTPVREWKLSGDPSMVYIAKAVRHREFRLEIARLSATDKSQLSEDESKNWYLVRMKGGDEDISGHVFLAKWRFFAEGHAYMTNIKGRPRSLLYYPIRNQETWEFIAQEGKPWQLAPDPSAAEIGEELFVRYYEQVDSGIQEKLAPSTREGRMQSQERMLDNTRAELKAACNLGSITIDWSTVKEGLTDEYHIARACSKDVQKIIDFCESYSNAIVGVETMSNVRCDFSRYASPQLSQLVIEGDELHYYLGPNASSKPVTGLTVLRTHFGEMDQVLEGAKRRLINRYRKGEETEVYIELENRYYPIGRTPMSSHSTVLTSGIRKAFLDDRGKEWSLVCDAETIPLARLVGEKRSEVLSNAVFEKEALWKREPYFLARDTHGVYYYVDHYRQEFGGRHFRVFVGKRGMLKLTKLKGLVEDSEGTVFSTQKGDLRLIVNPKASALWIRGNKRSELTAVDPYRNRKLIYDELGVYLGEKIGHICDE